MGAYLRHTSTSQCWFISIATITEHLLPDAFYHGHNLTCEIEAIIILGFPAACIFTTNIHSSSLYIRGEIHMVNIIKMISIFLRIEIQGQKT